VRCSAANFGRNKELFGEQRDKESGPHPAELDFILAFQLTANCALKCLKGAWPGFAYPTSQLPHNLSSPELGIKSKGQCGRWKSFIMGFFFCLPLKTWHFWQVMKFVTYMSRIWPNKSVATEYPERGGENVLTEESTHSMT